MYISFDEIDHNNALKHTEINKTNDTECIQVHVCVHLVLSPLQHVVDNVCVPDEFWLAPDNEDKMCYHILLVFRCHTDGGSDGIWWPALSGHRLFCNVCWQEVFSIKWLIYGILFLHSSTSPWRFCHEHSFWMISKLVQGKPTVIMFRFTFYTKHKIVVSNNQ